MGVGTTCLHQYIHTRIACTSLTFFSISPSRVPISVLLAPSLSARRDSKRVLQPAEHCASPQRPSVTFSAPASIFPPVIIGCLFCYGSTTIAAVSLQTRPTAVDACREQGGGGFFVGPPMAAAFPMRCIDPTFDSEQSHILFERLGEVCGQTES